MAPFLIGGYIDHVGSTPVNSKGDLPMANTLCHHATAAETFLNTVMGKPFSLYRQKGGKMVLHPFVGDRIQLRRKWQKPREKREPYTFQMFQTFHTMVSKAEAHDIGNFLDLPSLVFDTQCLGIFTGSRVSEYAQSKGSVATVSRVPQPASKPSSLAPAVAFIASDFLFLAANGTIIPHAQLFLDTTQAVQLQIRFRHDKSGRNHSIRKYGRGSSWMCPIEASIRLLRRAHKLRIPAHDPVCAYRKLHGLGHRWLRDYHVSQLMRRVAVQTYPDKNHFLRVNIDRFASHSNRVTAAVALHHAGMSIDDIAQRLRWKPLSVSFYLRETTQDIGQYTIQTIVGAQRAYMSTAASA
jgi:hypothetical protein